jgi:RimJ/RimL family protein N-acetyltransferase
MLIRSTRLLLRAVEDTDAAFVAGLFNGDGSVVAYGPHFPVSARAALDRLRTPHSVALIGQRLADDTPVGIVRFRLSWGDSVMNIEDVIFSADHRGSGYGREALGALLSHFFRRWGGRRVELQVRAQNGRAVRTYKGLGFVEEGRRRQVVPAGWGADIDPDYLLMGLLADEYLPPESYGGDSNERQGE